MSACSYIWPPAWHAEDDYSYTAAAHLRPRAASQASLSPIFKQLLLHIHIADQRFILLPQDCYSMGACHLLNVSFSPGNTEHKA